MSKTLKISIFCLVFLILWQIWIMRIASTYIADDSPETIVSMYTLGIQHPPGYVLNSLIGKIFLMLPVGSAMFRSAIMAAFFHILAAYILFMIVLHIYFKDKNKKYYIAAVAAVLYLFSNTAILESYSAKGSIYTLHSFLIAVIFISVFKIKENIRWLYFASLIMGLSFGNHWQSSAVIFPATAIAIYFSKVKINIKNWLISGLFFILGISIIIYLFIRSSANPVLSWGEVRDFKSLIWLLSRAQYSAVENAHTIIDTFHLMIYYFTIILPQQFPLLLVFLFIPGIILLLKNKFYHGLVLSSALIFTLLGVFFMSKPGPGLEWIIKPYFTFTYMFISVFISVAIFYLIDLIQSSKTKKMLCFATSLIIFILLLINAPDYSEYFYGYDYSNNIFLSLPANSLYFAEGDLNINGAIYNTYLNKKSVNVINVQWLAYNWYRDQVKRNMDNVIMSSEPGFDFKDDLKKIMIYNKNRPIYYSNAISNNILSYDIAPKGLVNEVLIDNKQLTDDPYLYYQFYSYRGLIEKKQTYDDATKLLVSEVYGKELVKIAKTFETKNDVDNTLLFYKRAFIFYKNDMLAVNIAHGYAQKGSDSSAEYFLNEAVKINKKCIIALEGLTVFAMRRGNNDSAKKYLQIILNYDPEDEQARAILNKLNSGV